MIATWRDNDCRWQTVGMVCFFFILVLSWSRCEAAPFNARVAYVIDGDTITVQAGEKRIRIRLWGIDTPEKAQPYSDAARRFTIGMLLGRTVEIVPVQRDDYGRLVASVFVAGRNAGEELVRSGWAWVHIYYCRRKICRSWRVMEKEARHQRIGLWQEKRPVAPWVWKRKHR